MIRHIAPELVRTAELEAARDGGLAEYPHGDYYRNGARVNYDAVENSDNGSFGDPSEATAERGRELFEAAADQLVELLGWLDDQPIEDLLAPAHVDPQPGSRR